MASSDPRVDAYIERSADFAQPILHFLREAVHAACPDVEETIKWGMPMFMHHGNLCSMAAFKQHAAFAFWKNSVVVGSTADGSAMGQFGRISHCRDLPTKKVLSGFVRAAMKLNVAGVKPERVRAAPKPAADLPNDLVAALRKQRKAGREFATFTDSQRREYIEWIVEAKRAETRQRRLDQAIEWIAEGKQRNWKYMNC